MKILIITDWFLPSLGGVQQHTYTLAQFLSKLPYEVHVVTSPSRNPSLDFRLDQDLRRLHKIEVFRKLPLRRRLPIFNSANYILDCQTVVEYINKHKFDYDIIHYHGTRQLFFKFVKTKTPIITSVHGIFPACALQYSRPCKEKSVARCALCHLSQWPKHAIVLPIMVPYYFSYYRLMERSLESVHKVICVSDYVKRYIKKSFNLTNLVTVHNFVDYEGEINPQLTSSDSFNIRSDLDLPPDAKIITYFGRLIPEKGVDLLIKAFKRIHKRADDNIYLLIGGEGSQRTQLENVAKETTGVIFTGFVPRKNQLATIAQSDVFVHPARYPEAFGITILEAMALGLPVVATRVGGIPEFVVDGKGGYLVTPNSSADLATKIYNVLNNETFKSEAKAFNLEWSRKFDITHIGQKIIKIYESSLT